MNEISVDQQAHVRLAVTDRAGNPGKIDGVPTWSSSDEALMSVVVDASDPLVALCVPADGAADQAVNVTVEVDADLGEGVKPIVGVLAFAITGGAAKFVELSVDSVEDKPA